MTDTYKVLGQVDASAGVLTDLYTAPGATSLVSSSIVVCNRNSYEIHYRISVAVAGAADDPKQYLAWDVPLGKNDSFPFVLGATLAATDKIRVQSSSGGVSFNAFGVEVT